MDTPRPDAPLGSVDLTCHPWTRADAVRGIVVDVRRSVQGTLALSFRVDGEIARVRVPRSRMPRRVDRLWEHTCFEAFVAVEGAAAYHELNFAPSSEWAGYAFSAYREVVALHDEPLAPRIAVRADDDQLALDAFVVLDRLAPGLSTAPLRLGLAAVIEGSDGALAYWALHHPPGKPDFHHLDTRILSWAHLETTAAALPPSSKTLPVGQLAAGRDVCNTPALTGMSAHQPGDQALLSMRGLGDLLQALSADGCQLVGPTVRGGAIVHAEIAGIEDLPAGWTEVQEAGTYRLRRREDRALFGYSVGPQSWKQFFFVPRLRLWQARRDGDGFTVEAEQSPPPRLALIGVRSCDLHAIAVQDRTFLQGAFVDPDYAARRAAAFVLAVNCGQAGGTCFCVSMATGPRVTQWFDLALTELLDEPHRFLVEVGSERGATLLARVTGAPATDADRLAADRIVERTAHSMGRRLDTGGIKELLQANYEHPRWDEVAVRCLSCANCTMVCPTCFCSTVEDVTDLAGEHAERWRRWDSCFTLEHSYIHGGSVRTTTRSRYRQWLTHKLATWIDQFGTSGCVGCGRCITWCPVGIDLTEEVGAIRASHIEVPETAEETKDGDA